MTEIALLSAAAADDPTLVTALSDLVNRAYEVAEKGLWRDGVARTTPAETAEGILLGQLALAREGDRLVGGVRTRQLDPETGWFGALAVEPTHGRRGVGRGLVDFAERRAVEKGAGKMQLELLVPVPAHPHTDVLAAWYGRLGYREMRRCELAEFEPTAVPFLAAQCEVAVLQKPLA